MKWHNILENQEQEKMSNGKDFCYFLKIYLSNMKVYYWIQG